MIEEKNFDTRPRWSALIYMLDSYCADEKVALFKSRCGHIVSYSISAFRPAARGAANAPAQDPSPDRSLASPIAVANASPLSSPSP